MAKVRHSGHLVESGFTRHRHRPPPRGPPPSPASVLPPGCVTGSAGCALQARESAQPRPSANGNSSPPGRSQGHHARFTCHAATRCSGLQPPGTADYPSLAPPPPCPATSLSLWDSAAAASLVSPLPPLPSAIHCPHSHPREKEQKSGPCLCRPRPSDAPGSLRTMSDPCPWPAKPVSPVPSLFSAPTPNSAGLLPKAKAHPDIDHDFVCSRLFQTVVSSFFV